MFTGLIQAVGSIFRLKPMGDTLRIAVDVVNWHHGAKRGESIAVSGVCLTVAEHPDGIDGMLTFDVIKETLDKTGLGSLEQGDRVNLEPALRASDRMGGHAVQGHVDGLGTLASVVTEGEWRIRVSAPADLAKFLVPKGSVCIDGVSLTIAALNAAEGWFEVALIPETLAKTTLGDLKVGDTVNLEMDVLSKTIVHYLETFLEHRSAGVS
ncbi:MAG: riboflavin synthase [Planctomycetota bacterium]